MALYDQLSLHSDTFKGPVVGPMILYVDHADGQEDIATTCLSSMDSVFLLKIAVTKHCDMNTIKSTERLNADVFMIADSQPLAKAPLIPVIREIDFIGDIDLRPLVWHNAMACRVVIHLLERLENAQRFEDQPDVQDADEPPVYDTVENLLRQPIEDNQYVH